MKKLKSLHNGAIYGYSAALEKTGNFVVIEEAAKRAPKKKAPTRKPAAKKTKAPVTVTSDDPLDIETALEELEENVDIDPGDGS